MTKVTDRNAWVDHLRSFITLLVVAHHASLAYTTFAHFNREAYITSTHPVVDTARWKGLDIFEDFNDIFFMSLMFLISGIFVMRSLQHKGPWQFTRDRFYRLFLPFLAGVTVLMLCAYYPPYYLAYGRHDGKAYIIDFFTVEAWPVGPPWFIWVLWVFNVLFAVCYPFIRNGFHRLGQLLALQQQHPFRLFVFWYLFTWLLYVPMVLYAGAGTWTGIGPFDFQISRVCLYSGYFLLGVAAGAPGLENSIFAGNTSFTRKWPVWALSAWCVCMPYLSSVKHH